MIHLPASQFINHYIHKLLIQNLRNPPYPPFFKGGNLLDWLVKSPFEKGEIRGIASRSQVQLGNEIKSLTPRRQEKMWNSRPGGSMVAQASRLCLS
jgi:hypothetical protein